MSGKLSRKERARLQSEQHKASQQVGETTAPAPKKKPQQVTARSGFKDNELVRRLNLILIILAAGVYLNSLGNQYALDDYGLILENQDTKSGSLLKILTSSYREGTLGGDNTLYRPLSKMMFNLEWKLSPENPFIGHFMNVALFTLSVVLLFRMLRRYMTGNVIVPFIATAIFAVHPIHTEVVANIKGRDDILCFLFFVIAALYIHRFVTSSNRKYLVFAGVSYLLCMLSKESAITFVAIFPLLLFFFTKADQQKIIQTSAVTGGVVLFFLGVRWLVLHGGGASPVPVIDNYIAGIDGFAGQRATAIAIAGIYLLKLFVPYELVCDASVPQMPEYGLGSWQFLVSLVIYGAAFAFAIMKLKSKHPVSFAILYFLITFSIVSNIPFLLGTNYGERLLYAPSLGICLIVAWGLHKLFFAEDNPDLAPNYFFGLHKKPMIVAGIIVVVYSGITVMRNPVWYDNVSLYGTDMQISENSCKLHYFYANHLTQDEYLVQFPKGSAEWNQTLDTAQAEFRNAINLYPGYGDAIQKLAEVFYDKGQKDSSEYYYKLAIHTSPAMASYRSNYGRILFEQQRLPEAEYQFRTAVKLNARYPEAYNNLAAVYGTMGGQWGDRARQFPDSAASYNQKARELYNKSLQNSLNAIASNPNFVQAYETAAMTYGILGDVGNQQKYLQLANQLRASGVK